MGFVVYCPSDAFPTYKGDSFDVEYAIVRKRLSDGHLEMGLVIVGGGASESVRILYSRDCPCLLSPDATNRVSLERMQRQLHGGEPIDKEALELLRRPQSQPTLTHRNYSIKDNDSVEVATVRVCKQNCELSSISVCMKRSVPNLKADLVRVESIGDLFSSSDSTAITRRLVYRKEYAGIEMVVDLDLEDLPLRLASFACPMLSVCFALNLSFDTLSCSLDIG